MLKKIWIALFCGVLGLSFLIFNIFSKQLSRDNHENRLLTGLPQVLQSPLSQMPEQLDNFLADNSPFRYQLVSLNANLNYLLFGKSESDQVLAGIDGWLFYKDGPDAARPVANYQGLPDTFDSEETLAAAAASLDRLAATLAENGCTLILDITPSKDRVYQEYMPDAYPIVNTENRTDRFVAYLREHSSTPVSWQYDAIRAEALADPDRLLYYRTDTHWNGMGAVLGLDGVLSAAGMDAVDFDAYEFTATGVTTGDLANVSALYTLLPEENTWTASNYSELYSMDPRTVGVLGDSFSEYYMPYLQQRFDQCWRLTAETDLTPEKAADPGCDLMILEVTERNLDLLLDLLAQF